MAARRHRPAPAPPSAPDRTTFPAYRIEQTDTLLAYKNNPRTHSPEQVALLAEMITEYGWTNPILIDGARGVIAGHGRLLAAKQLGMESVPVIELSHLTPDQRRAYVIADNQSALRAGWDTSLLRIELGELGTAGFDLRLTGFDPTEIGELFADRTGGLTDPDDAPPAPEHPVSRLGDVWLLGRHRLACGDSTRPEAVTAALGGARPHLMVTDPPYGVSYDADWRNRAIMIKGEQRGDHGSRAIGVVMNDGQSDWREAWALFPGAVAYVWHGGLHGESVVASLAACRFEIRAQIIWVKTRPVISRGHYHWQHEPALYGVREGEDEQWSFVPEHEVASYSVRQGETGHWTGSRKQSTVWNIEHLKSDTGHSTQKPVECMRRPMENNSRAGQAVYEPFSGSGTTIIAAEMTGRTCHAIELSPAYVDVGVLRWEAFTGGQATLASDGRTFDQIAEERQQPATAAA